MDDPQFDSGGRKLQIHVIGMEDYVARASRLGKDVTIDWFDAGHGHGATDTKVAWCRRSIEFVESKLGVDAPPL